MNTEIQMDAARVAHTPRGQRIDEKKLLADLGLAGVLSRGAHLTWLLLVETGKGKVCNDAIISWDEEGDISAAIVDRTSGEPEVTVGFEAFQHDDGSFTLRATDETGDDVLRRFREAVAGMELASDEEQPGQA